MKRSARRLPALILAAGVMIGLAACTPPVSNLAGCVSPYTAGDNSSAVTADGKLGALPKVDFPTPLVAKDAQVSVLEQGDGAVVYPTNTVEIMFSTWDPTSGEAAGDSGFDEPRRYIANANLFAKFTECTTVGSRIAVVADALSIFGSVDAASQAGVDPKAILVAVIDVLDTYLGKANGWDQFPQAGMPSVVLAPNGEPGIITPNEDAPKDLRIATLKAGTGDAVKEGDDVVVQYTGLVWGNDTTFQSTWDQGAPAAFTVASGGLVEGFIKALVGQKVGSQVLAVIPPELGYPDGNQEAGIPAGSTLIFVIDILKTTTPED